MSYFLAILVYLACLVSCLGYGFLVMRLLGLDPRLVWRTPSASHENRILNLLYAAALGMGTLAYLVLAVGLAGWLRAPVLGVLVAAGWAPAVLAFRRREGRKTNAEGRKRSPGASHLEPSSALALILGVFVGLLALSTLLSALRPMDSWDWDSLSYHLAAPKIYLEQGRILFIAYDHHTQFPFTLEMLYTVGLAFGGPAAAKLFHWGAAWLCATAIGVWTSRLEVGGRRVPEWAGPLAAALFGSMPVVLWEAGTAYIDLGTSLFQFLALAALIDAVRTEDGRIVGLGRSRALLAAVLTGFALGTKYTALIQFGLLGLGLLFLLARADRKARGEVLAGTLGFGILALLIASPWYVKNWLWVHNPVYPFFYGLFPHSFSWSAEQAAGYANEQAGFGLPERNLGNYVRAFWNLGLHGREFWINGKHPAGDILASVGAGFAGLLPLALWARGLGWRIWALLGYGMASVTFWFFLSQQVRYLVPVFAPLAVLAAVTVAALPLRLRIAGGVFSAVVLVLSLGLYAPQAMASLAVVSGQVSEEEFLLNYSGVGPLYDASRWINANTPKDSRIALYEEPRGYFLDRDYLWANPGHHDMIPYSSLRSGRELVEALRRFRITHVWITHDWIRDKETAPWYRLLVGAIQTGGLEKVYETEGAEAGRRGVMIYRLPEAR